MDQAKKKILIVDDDRQFVKILGDWFGSHGFDILTAYNGKDAIDLFYKDNPDVVLLDALLPKMDGFKTCQAMRKIELKKNVPIIMMSAIYRKQAEIIRAKTECGATDYLTKPLNLTEVYNKVMEELLKLKE